MPPGGFKMAASIRGVVCGIASRFLTTPNVHATNTLLKPLPALLEQTRGHRYSYVDKHMIKDVRRRNTVKQYYGERIRLNSIRKNVILPKDIQDIADREVAALPRDSNYIRARDRCVLTSRPRGNIYRWRICRMQWRLLADYNKLSGVMRACF